MDQDTPESKTTFSSRLPRLIGILLLSTCFLVAAVRMVQLPLWGWWPLVLLISFWAAVILIFLPKDPTAKKWLASATLSGVLMGLGFPPCPLTFVVFFAWIPLLAVENGIYQRQGKIQPGKVFFYAYHTFVLWNIIATFWVTNTALIAGILANFLNAAFMAGVMVAIHIIQRKLPARYALPVLLSFWIGFEYLHFQWDLSWPWLTLGHAMAEYPWAIQWYEVTGVFGGSLWILLVNWLGYDTIMRWLRARPLKIFRYVFFLFIPLVISLMIWFTVKEGDAPEAKVTIVQPNFEPHYEKFDLPEAVQARRFFQLSVDHIDSTTQYLVFPETSFEGVRLNTFKENLEMRLFQAVIDSFPDLRLVMGISSYRILEKDQFKDAQVRVHVNGQGDTTYWDIQNAAVQLTSGSSDYEVYFKSKLVPGPEMFPFRKLLFFMKPIVEKLDGSYEGHTKQKERAVFAGGALQVAPVICYESIYGAYVGEYVKKGATAFFIITNDGWWDDTPGHVQHLKLGALRAIEHRRPIARSANTGISAFIDIKGRIHSPTRYGETIAIVGKIKPETRMTFYTREGDLIPKIAILGVGLICFLWFYFRFRAT